MAFSSDDGARTQGAQMRAGDLAAEADWGEPSKPHRDIKKLLLVIGLGGLSWVATYVGMLELIEANMGDLPLVHKIIIAFSVGMLMTMIVWLLDQIFAPIGLFTKLLYAGGYVFLTIISVGFGFGFYWKVLESRSEASRSAESAISQVQGSLHAASTRLEQLQSTLVQLTAISNQKAEIERSSGASCPNSKPGDGPRRKLREEDAGRFSFASDFVKGRAEAVKADIAALDVDFTRIAKDDKSTVDAKTGTRNEFMKGLSRKLDMTVTGFNAFRTDAQLKQIKADLAERAEKVTFVDTKGGTYSCPDPQLQTALRGVVRAIDQLPEMEKPKIAAVEGSEATIEAFRRLTATFYGLLAFKMPPSADELRQLQQKAVQSVEGGAAGVRNAAAAGEQAGLAKRDYVPLAIAIFVDICLLLVSMGRPVNRLHGLVPKMKAAENGPVYQILSRFSDIHKDKETREKFEIFRHVVFDFNGDYYVAVPLNAPLRANPEQRLDLQLEAHLLSNLFSSFEKERIFSRVYSPFLTTKAIQKRLWRQGSKFAGSEAFRAYRFRDGAWSEIILGAVMGAARRVGTEKRRRVMEEGHRLPIPGEEAAPAAPPAATIEQLIAAALDKRGYGTNPAATSERMARNGYHNGFTRPERPRTMPPARENGRAFHMTGGGRDRTPRDREALERQFGPYADSLSARTDSTRSDGQAGPRVSHREMMQAVGAVSEARERVGEAEVSVAAANSNTAPPASRFPAAREPLPAEEADVPAAAHAAAATADNVIVMPRVLATQRPAEAQPVAQAGAAQPAQVIDVTVRRETATFTVPVSEAHLPPSLARLLGQAVVTGQALHKTEEPNTPGVLEQITPNELIIVPQTDEVAQKSSSTALVVVDAQHEEVTPEKA